MHSLSILLFSFVVFLFNVSFYPERLFFCAFKFECKYLGVLQCFEMHVFKLSDFHMVQKCGKGAKRSLQVLTTRNMWAFVFLGMGKVMDLCAA